MVLVCPECERVLIPRVGFLIVLYFSDHHPVPRKKKPEKLIAKIKTTDEYLIIV